MSELDAVVSSLCTKANELAAAYNKKAAVINSATNPASVIEETRNTSQDPFFVEWRAKYEMVLAAQAKALEAAEAQVRAMGLLNTVDNVEEVKAAMKELAAKYRSIAEVIPTFGVSADQLIESGDLAKLTPAKGVRAKGTISETGIKRPRFSEIRVASANGETTVKLMSELGAPTLTALSTFLSKTYGKAWTANNSVTTLRDTFLANADDANCAEFPLVFGPEEARIALLIVTTGVVATATEAEATESAETESVEAEVTEAE